MAKVMKPTLTQLNSEDIIQLANKYWSSDGSQFHQFDSKLIEDIYKNQILSSHFSVKRIMLLEMSHYLENYLWLNYVPGTNDSVAHLMSIVVMVNEKFRERVSSWNAFTEKPEHFGQFFNQIARLSVEDKYNLTIKERTALLTFITHCFNGVEVDLIREQIQKYVSLPIWINLSKKRLEFEFEKSLKLKKFWNLLQKKDKQLTNEAMEKVQFERHFLVFLLRQFITILSTIPSVDEVENLSKRHLDVVCYCERFIDFLIDLEALLPTRRFFNAVLDDSHVVILAFKSNLYNRKEGKLFGQLLEMLEFYVNFEIDEITGEALTDKEMMKKHYETITRMQKVVYQNFPDLKPIYISNVGSIDTRENLLKHLNNFNDEQLVQLASLLNLGDEDSLKNLFNKELILELMIKKHEKTISQLQSLNEMPLYPCEKLIWDDNLISSDFYYGDTCLALPKLNLQFLTLHDYLMRNFHLFRLESTYEIRQDIEDAVSRLKPWKTEDGGIMFGGWARMGLSIDNFAIVEVGKPKIGEKKPSRVRADIVVNLNVRKEIKNEWESLRKHDVCFLVCVRPTVPPGTAYKYKELFIPQVGLTYVRGCEIEGMLDPQGRIIDETASDKPFYDTDNRTYRVWLDCNQYKIDMDEVAQGKEDVYDTFNILIRRKPKENNFKAVLESIRDLMNTECVVPEWLHDIILGYGDPSAAHYNNMPNKLTNLDFFDTFLDYQHVKESFPNTKIIPSVQEEAKLIPPFKLTFNQDESVTAIPYILPSRGPYSFEIPKKNSVRFTPIQIEAIKSGINPGLTMVVGPPGTGKTDVAVQIINLLYHNFPDQRILIVTHSNQALNALFEKIMALDIDERHLLRLGHGEEALFTEKDFSRYGRVNYVLAKRLQLLNEVSRLALSIGIQSDVAYTCETASYFFLYHILSRWEEFLSKLSKTSKNQHDIQQLFPFTKFFDDAPQPIFNGSTFDDNLEIARGCYRYIKKIFTKLDEFKAFEMLRSGLDRSKYLLVREAKIIAMTCTHAALKRKELVNMEFQYDNILMEESAQILEIETFIPLLLQNPENGHNRLKRWIMIGDHHQLPPVIKNMIFQKFSNMEQSLFTRFVRLGVPTIDLDAQGRARPSLNDLYNWRYKNLGNLPHVWSTPEFRLANAGLYYILKIILFLIYYLYIIYV